MSEMCTGCTVVCQCVSGTVVTDASTPADYLVTAAVPTEHCSDRRNTDATSAPSQVTRSMAPLHVNEVQLSRIAVFAVAAGTGGRADGRSC